MKSYPHINYYGDNWGLPIIAFDKIDGSNIRAEYSKKRGFYKFGTRNVMIDENHEVFGEAIKLFITKYAEGLDRVFKSKDYRDIQSFVCFAEFYGPNSQFGQHIPEDKKDIVLFDVSAYKKGFIKPKQFIDDFGPLGIPNIVYTGNLNHELVNDIKNNKYNLREGVIAKGVIRTKKESEMIYQCKIKTNEWFDRLRALKGDKAVEEELKPHNIK